MAKPRQFPKLLILFLLVKLSSSNYNYNYSYNKYKVKSHTKLYTSYAYTPAPPSQTPLRLRHGLSRPKPAEGPNIRPFQCKSRNSGQVGVCMFVWECGQANGTHIDVCQDGFYIGSCCQLDEKLISQQLQTNEIGGFPSLQQIPTTTSTPRTTTTRPTTTTTARTTTKRIHYTTQPSRRTSPTTTFRSTTTISYTSRIPETTKITSTTPKLTVLSTTVHPLLLLESTLSPNEIIRPIGMVNKTTSLTTTRSPYFSVASPTFRSTTTTTRPLSIFASLSTTTENWNTNNSLQDADFFSENGTLLISNFKQICGRQFLPTSRIVGGITAANGEWPWQVSVRVWSPMEKTFLHACGAVLLSESWAATAAHCLEKISLNEIILRMGDYDLSEDVGLYGFIERRVQLIIPHPKFSGMRRSFEYDLALVRFYEPVVFQPNIVPICIPDADDNFEGQMGYVTGWGRLREKGPIPAQLHEVQLPIISNAKCETMFKSVGLNEFIPKIFLCAAWPEGDKDACDGDSGSGLSILREDDKRWILGGIVSWGHGCGVKNQPGVYTRITEFRNWINLILSF